MIQENDYKVFHGYVKRRINIIIANRIVISTIIKKPQEHNIIK